MFKDRVSGQTPHRLPILASRMSRLKLILSRANRLKLICTLHHASLRRDAGDTWRRSNGIRIKPPRPLSRTLFSEYMLSGPATCSV